MLILDVRREACRSCTKMIEHYLGPCLKSNRFKDTVLASSPLYIALNKIKPVFLSSLKDIMHLFCPSPWGTMVRIFGPPFMQLCFLRCPRRSLVTQNSRTRMVTSVETVRQGAKKR